MKKKYIILISFILVAAVGIIGFYLLTRATILGNMSNEYSTTYTLVAKCDDFIGTYKISVYLDKINTSTDSSLL